MSAAANTSERSYAPALLCNRGAAPSVVTALRALWSGFSRDILVCGDRWAGSSPATRLQLTTLIGWP